MGQLQAELAAARQNNTSDAAMPSGVPGEGEEERLRLVADLYQTKKP